MNWLTPILTGMGRLLERVGLPIFAFFAGKKQAEQKERLKQLIAERKARNEQAKKDRIFRDAMSEPDVVERMRAILAREDSDQ